MKKILITGGAGFLGYHIANILAKKGHELRLLDIADYVKEEYPAGVEFLNGDIRDTEVLKKAIEGVDAVIHGAAALPLWSKKDIFTINVDGTRNVLEVCKQNGIKRVVLVSSTAVYGVPKKHPLYETDPMVGVGNYGESKIRAEKVCEEYRENGMCVPIIRPKTFIGTGRLGVFQILFDWVQCGKRIPILGNGKNRYQLLEVEDLVEAIYLVTVGEEGKVNSTFNVGAEEYDTVAEDVGALCDFAGGGARVLRTPAWLIVPALRFFELIKLSPLYKWVYGTASKDSFVSIDKIKEQLGWKPQYSNSQALIRAYKWYLEHYEELEGEGVTHRVAWNQGILKLFKKIM